MAAALPEEATVNDDQLENPVLGYVVITVALLVGMLSATVFGQSPASEKAALAKATRTASAPSQGSDSPTADSPAAVSQAHKPAAVTLPAARTLTSSEPLTMSATIGARRWILGVRSKATSTGCVITSVVPGSPAARSGLTVGDRILTVNGTQVGWLADRLTSLHHQIDASPRRVIPLLVQRSGSGKVHVYRVRLTTLSETLGH